MTLYTNTLGGFEPNATISHYGGSYGKGGYLSITSVAINNPHNSMRWDNAENAPDAISKWAEENGYSVHASKDGYGAYRATLVHRATYDAQRIAFEMNEKKFENAEAGFIRYGDIPTSGYSKNAATGTTESGVSVFRAEFSSSGEYRPLLSSNQQVGSLLSLIADGRPVYRVWGEVVGTGGDGEPTIKIDRIELITE